MVLNLDAAAVPRHTWLRDFRQNGQAWKELLTLFAQEVRCSRIMLSDGKFIADLAAQKLRDSSVMDTYTWFSIYIFTEADVLRIQLLA